MNLQYNRSSLQGEVHLPTSKSMSNRALIIQALAKNKITIDNLSSANDTVLLQNLLHQIQYHYTEGMEINVQDAGTSFRFLLAYLSIQEGKKFVLTGTKRMQERPIAALVNALRDLGADIEYVHNQEFPPLIIHGKKLMGHEVIINANDSSQFVSALCLIAPVLPQGLSIQIADQLVSDSYVYMTLDMMKQAGISFVFAGNKINIPPQTYAEKHFEIEADWSSASFFYAIAMLIPETSLTMHGLRLPSLQGDANIVSIAKNFGVETTTTPHSIQIQSVKIEQAKAMQLDVQSFPDMAIPLLVACAIRYTETVFTGMQHLVHKESNRLLALQTELKKVNCLLHYEKDILRFEGSFIPSTNQQVLSFQTYHDHRLAMSFSFFALLGYTVELDDADCVSKSFPNFWEEVKGLGMQVVRCE